jgi:photoactive yellow protein
LLAWLEAATSAELDLLPFGVVAMAPDTTVDAYNRWESRASGLTPERVIGRRFFSAVATCMNNYLVAGRFASVPEIDAVADSVFTFRMIPRRVRLRMLKAPAAARIYLLIAARN